MRQPSNSANKIKNFCLIQLQIIRDRTERLRKEILDCKIQTEFLTDLLENLDEDDGRS
jgi:hypothetical protein